MSLAVPHVGGNATGANNTSTSDSWTSTSGSLIVVVGVGYNCSTFASGNVTDSKSNSYTLVFAGETATGNMEEIGIWVNDGGTRGASHTCTFAPTGGAAYSSMGVLEITGHLTPSPYDSTTSATATDGTSSYDVTAAAAISGNQIAIYACALDTGLTDTWTGPTGYTTVIEQASGASANVFRVAYKINETGTPTVGATWPTGVFAGRQVFVTFKEAAGGGGVTGTSAQTLANFTGSASGTVNNPPGVVYVKEVGFVTDTTAGTTSAITVASGGVPVGDYLVIFGACDNTGSSGAATTISVADNSSQSGSANTYALQTPQAIADPGAASAGQQGFFVVCPVTRALLAGDTITITYGNSTAAKAINCQQFTPSISGNISVLANSYARQDNQTGQSVSVAAGANPTMANQVVCALVAVEGGTADAFTQDTDTTNGSWVGLTRRGSGTTTSGSTLNSAYKVVTAAGAQTYDHATMLGTARDHCAAILVLTPPSITGTVAVTLANATSSATGTETITGTSAQTLANVTSAASGWTTVTGTSTQTLANFTSSGTGSIGDFVGGTVAVTLANATSSATATETFTGTSAQTLANFTGSASGWTTITGTSTQTLANFTGAATATEIITGTSARTLDNFVGFATDGVTRFVATVSSNGHYLKDQNGNPIFVYGNSPQNMVANGTLAEMEDFFVDQQSRGFNSAQVHLVYNFQADAESNTAPFGNDNNLAPQNSGYWATIDSMFDLAETYGFTLWATVLDNITCGTLVANNVSSAEAFAYGQFLGARYASRPNLVWVIGNDYDSSQWSALDTQYQQILAGIRDQGDTHLATIWLNTHPANFHTGYDTLIDIDNGYAYDTQPYSQSDDSYQLTRTGYPKPFVWFEGTYYGEHNAAPGSSTNLELRKLAWWTITWGGVGHFFGTNQVWQFANWASETGAAIYDHLQLIPPAFATLSGWQNLVPDFSHVFQTGGRGTFEGGNLDTDTFSTAAFINGGQLAVVYFPTSRGSITFDTTKLSGTVTAYWFDPTNGSTSTESNPAAPTHPGTNAGGDADWVLIFQSTGSVTGTAAVTLANFTSSASGTETFTGTSAQTLANATSSATGTEVFTGTSARTLADFTSSASGTETITGTSAQTLANVTSSASGTETITGTAAATLANFTGAASGLADIVGTSAQTLANVTASGSGTETITGTASPTLANFTSTATGVVDVRGSAAVTLAGVTSSASGTETISGTAAVTLANFTSAASGLADIIGTSTQTLANFTSAASGSVTNPGSNGAAVLGDFTSNASGSVVITGTSAQTLGNVTSSGTGTETITGTAAVTLGNATSSATGTETITGSGAVTLAGVTSTGTGTETIQGTSARTLANFTSTATGAETITGTVAITLAGVTSSASGTASPPTGTAATTLANFTSSAIGSVVNPPSGLATPTPFDENIVVYLGGSGSTRRSIGIVRTTGNFADETNLTVVILDQPTVRHSTLDELTITLA